jgi:hypothetical protein
MNKIKERLTMVGLIIFALVIVYYLIGALTSVGSSMTTISGAEDAWGFRDVAGNLGLVFFIIIGLMGAGFMVWTIYKARRGSR